MTEPGAHGHATRSTTPLHSPVKQQRPTGMPTPYHRPRLSPVTNQSLASSSSYFGLDTGHDSTNNGTVTHSPHISDLQTPSAGVHSKWAALQSGMLTSLVAPSSFNFAQQQHDNGERQGNPTTAATTQNPFAQQMMSPPPFYFRLNQVPPTPGASSSSSATAHDHGISARHHPSGSSPSLSLDTRQAPAVATPSSSFPKTSPNSAEPSYNLSRAQQAAAASSSNKIPSFASFRSPAASVGRPSASSIASVNPRFKPVLPSELVDRLVSSLSSSQGGFLALQDTLLLDMRTHTAFVQSHVASSVSICVPSTLLRRPAYGIDRITDGLSQADQERFGSWKSARAVIVMDADSTQITEASGIASMLAKFDKAQFAGELLWLRGGWVGIARELNSRDSSLQARLLDSGESSPLADGAASSGSQSGGEVSFTPTTSASVNGSAFMSPPPSSKKHGRPVLQVRDLPASAFQQSSTSAYANSGMQGSTFSLGGRPTGETGHGVGGESRPHVVKRRKSTNEGYKDVATRSDAALTTNAEKRVATNPFFDNIRQNTEALSLERSMENLSPIEFASVPDKVYSQLPKFLSKLLKLEPMQRARVLARQFYELEAAERERLEGTLNWHTHVQGRESDSNKAQQKFEKYGISAGVELGSLNRFKNIFPYDHSRVRLQRFSNGATDYINASHVHLSGSRKRFIASQGPLPTTYSDFWQTCDQEQVGVIVMLTNLHEGGREKCGKYWIDDSSQAWQVETSGTDEDADAIGRAAVDNSAGFFAPAPKSPEQEPTPKDTTVRRNILLRRRSDSPTKKPRRIRHIQYRAWPDFDLPAKPEDVVALVQEVDEAQQEYMREIGWEGDVEPPIVTHCSAGCGRTGVFILVSTVLEKYRNERAAARRAAASINDHKMDLDGEGQQSFDQSSYLTPVNPTFPPSATGGAATPSSLIPNTAALSLHPSPASPLSPSMRLALQQSSSAASPSPSSSSSSAAGSTSTPLPTVLPSSADSNAVPALDHIDPVFAGTEEMRHQRMSMIANYRQFVCVHECVLVGIRDMILQEEGPSSS
ncbi:hypothetical protein ACM66B_004577 [Microbotryomycetes sp. NB124-2]